MKLEEFLVSAAICAGIYAFATGKLDHFISEQRLVYSDLSEADCQTTKGLITGTELKNEIGGRFEIKFMSDFRLIRQSKKELVCTSVMVLDNGRKSLAKIIVSKPDDDSMIYEVMLMQDMF